MSDARPAHIPELDGLRAIAVLSVMIFHLGIFPIGWMGVPLFFVLSGFLITRILVAQSDQSLKSYLGVFYWRRTVRIFPLYYAYLGVNAVLAIAMGWSLSGYGWFVAYLGNHQIGNMSPDVPGGMIGHLWSLAVEEQFYLIWPFVVFFFARHLKVICLVVIAAAFLARYAILGSTDNPYLTIVTLASCMDMLAAGAFAAFVRDRLPLIIMGIVGAVIVTYGFVTVGYAGFVEATLWVPQASYMYTGLGLLLCPLMRLAHLMKPLAAAPMLYIGKISYGLYMWHLLAFAIAHRLPVPTAAQGAIGMAVSFAIAAASWHFFESRLLKYKDRYGSSGLAGGQAARAH